LRSLPLGFIGRSDHDYAHYHTHNPKPEAETSTKETTHALIDRWQSMTKPRGRYCRKIVFRIKSHDQGWGGSDPGAYETSYTWFDVGLERLCAYKEVAFPDDVLSETLNSSSREAYTIVHNNEKSAKSQFFPQFNFPGDEVDDETIITLRTTNPTTKLDATDDSPTLVFEHSLHASDMCLQKNRTAHRTTQGHTIVWSYDDNVSDMSPEGKKLVEQGRGAATLNGEFVRNLKAGDIVTLWAKARFPGWVNIIEDASIEVYWAV